MRDDKKKVLRNKAIADEAKSGGCVLCGESRLPCLDFHHTDEKTDSINLLVQRHKSVERLEAEIAKCIVVCSNCHRLIHGPPAHVN